MFVNYAVDAAFYLGYLSAVVDQTTLHVPPPQDGFTTVHRTPQSPPPRSHGELVEFAKQAHDRETDPDRKRMLSHLLSNTLRHHCKVGCAQQLAAVRQMVEDVVQGKYRFFKDFSKDALAPYVAKFHPAPKVAHRALGLNPPETVAERHRMLRADRGRQLSAT